MSASDPTNAGGLYEVAFEAFGVTVGVSTNDARAPSRIEDFAPPHSRPYESGTVDHHFTLTTGEEDLVSVRYDIRDGVVAGDLDIPSYVATDVDFELGLGLLETHLHGCIAFRAVDRIFIEAAVVGYQGRVIVVPGGGLTGKTTLAAALVGAGASYYSDQYAVIDEQGLVHPYARPLPAPSRDLQDHATEAAPIGAVIVTSYRPGSDWAPERLSPGEGALALLSHAVAAQDRPEQVLRVINRALEHHPVILSSDRDEAESVAPLLLAELERAPAGPA